MGNYPGPNTLAVSVMEWAAPHLFARAAARPESAALIAGRLYRAIVTSASVGVPRAGAQQRPLSPPMRVALVQAVQEGNLGRLRVVNWSARFMTGPAWSGANAVACVICLIAVIRADDPIPARRRAAILMTGSGAVLNIAVTFQRFHSLLQQGLVRGPAGKALGVVGASAAIVIGVVSAQEEYESGDTVGMWAQIGTAGAGALSVAGFLVAAGGATTMTVAGAPVGVVLMGVGAGSGPAPGSSSRSGAP